MFENVGLFEATLFGVGPYAKVNGVLLLPVNIVFRTDCGGVIRFAEVKLKCVVLGYLDVVALVRLTGPNFGVYVLMNETDGVALLLTYVVLSVCVDETIAREDFLDNVIGPKEIVCDCVTEEDVEILVELVVVTDVVECNVLFNEFDTRDEVAFSEVNQFVASDASSLFLLFQMIRWQMAPVF